MISHTKHQSLGLVVPEKKIFRLVSYIQLCKIGMPLGPGPFWPGGGGHNLNNLGRGPLDVTIYKILKL